MVAEPREEQDALLLGAQPPTRCTCTCELTVHTWVEKTHSTSTSKPVALQCERPHGHEADGRDAGAFHWHDHKKHGRILWTDQAPRAIAKTVRRMKR